MIHNAKDVLLSANPGTLPNVGEALMDWFQPLVLSKVKKSVVNGELYEKVTSYPFMGVVQPFTAQNLEMAPSGQRKWKWYTIHCFPSLILEPDDEFKFKGNDYRVMSKSDWTEYGYIEYHVIQDYA